MSESETPAINITIRPRFNSGHQVDYLEVSLSIKRLLFKKGDNFVSFPSKLPRKTIISSHGDDWQATDDLGSLPIIAKTQEFDSTYEWIVQRDTSGEITFPFVATPATNGVFFCQGKAIDLRSDYGGLIGSGFSFIPIPRGDRVFDIAVEWNLLDAPEGTRAVWTFGEGPGRINRTGPASILSNSVYMVGAINSNPPEKKSDQYGYYWFGTLPSNIAVIRDIHKAFLVKVSEFFNETPSPDKSYRHFVRNNGSSKSFGGTSFDCSHIFDYDDQIAQVQDYDLIRRMAYEMVHKYLGPPITEPGIDFLFEGIKHALSIYLPFRPPNQFRTGEYFQATLSMLCMKYYTSPYLQLPQPELLKSASQNDRYAIEHVGTRAWAFVIGTDFAARKLAPKTKPPQRPIEDLAIKRLAVNKRDGKPYGINEWIDFLTPLMGEDARERYEYMCSGNPILLPVEVFGAKSHHLVQVDQEIFDIGMGRQGFEEGIVKDLKTGSRAEAAGLREGDEITWSSHTWKCEDDFTAELDVHVKRGNENVKMRFWPRSEEKAKSWQMVKVEDS